MKNNLRNLTALSRLVHFYSGILLSIFIGFHLFNHFLSIFGAEAHIEFMTSIRRFYRNWLVESLLMLVVILQIVTGIRMLCWGKTKIFGFFDKLHLWSGIYLAMFLVIHVSVVFIGRTFLNLDTNIYFGVAGLNSFPFLLFFIPYYSLGILSFFGHIAAIHYKKMKKNILGIQVYHQSIIILLIALIFAFSIIFGLTNHFNGFEIPNEYHVLIGK
jgi:hypothetical protein